MNANFQWTAVLTTALLAGCRSLPTPPVTDAPQVVAPQSAAPSQPAASQPAEDVQQVAYLSQPNSNDGSAPRPPSDLLPPGDDMQPQGPPAAPPLGEEVTEVLLDGITLAEAEQTALGNNPTLREAAALVAQTQGRWVQAGLYPNPEFGYVGSEINAEGTAGQQGAIFSQELVARGKLQWSRAAAAREVERARWEMQVQELRVLTDVRMQFYETLGAQETVTTAEELRAIAEHGVRIARQLEAALQAPRTDVLQAEVELNTAELLVRTSRQREWAARRQLAALMGVPDLPPGLLIGSLEDRQAFLDWSTACQRLFTVSPQLAAAQAKIARAQAQVRREQLEPFPNLSLQLTSQYDFGSDDPIYGAQLQAPLPLYDRNQGNVAAAAADVRRWSDDASRIARSLERRLAEVWQRYETSQTQSQVYESNILPRSRQSLDLITEAYEGGQLDFVRVLTARRTYFENRLRYLEALIAWRQAEAELEGFLLTGGLDAPDEGEAASKEN